MAFDVKIQIRAELEIDEAVFYYKTIQESLGKKFILDYENQLNTLYNFPFFENKYLEIRILPLKKFPYTIHFSVDEEKNIVYIEAVTNDYQNPKNTKIKY